MAVQTIKPVSDYGVTGDALTLSNLMERTLETVVAVYEASNVPLPSRRYWCINEPVEDCEQVVVSLLQTYLGIPGDQASDAQSCNSPRTAVLNVHITRNYPIGESGRAINPERIMTASEWGAVDTWMLMTALSEFDKDQYQVPGPGVIATTATREPRGGVQTTVMNLSLVIM